MQISQTTMKRARKIKYWQLSSHYGQIFCKWYSVIKLMKTPTFYLTEIMKFSFNSHFISLFTYQTYFINLMFIFLLQIVECFKYRHFRYSITVNSLQPLSRPTLLITFFCQWGDNMNSEVYITNTCYNTFIIGTK